MWFAFLALACSGKGEQTTTPPGETGTPIVDTSPQTTPPTDTSDTPPDLDTGTSTTDTACVGPIPADFVAEYADRYCVEWKSCNTSGAPCPTGTLPSLPPDCVYDPAAAEQCLCETWGCNTDVSGFEYPVGPAACNDVCG